MLSARRLAERSISSRFTSLVGVDFDNCWDCFTGGCGWKGCNSYGLFGLGVGGRTRRGGRFACVHHEEETWVDYLPTVEETPMDAPRTAAKQDETDADRWAMGHGR
mmetsp:Transcript_3290/g.5094  ORF Transcript_3290/g.5094 Transcript_3290/m.5094 type:complete len:106 (-) Transcript_3290:286-603(-)